MSAPHPAAARIITAARACLGTPFRPQGRDCRTGLDCAGLIIVTLYATGHHVAPIAPYALGGDGLTEQALTALASAGFVRRTRGTAAPGDLALFALAAGRPHLAILTTHGIVHAHAGLRRVVEGPADPAWPLLGHFLFPGAH